MHTETNDPLNLLTPQRFDIPAKTFFLKLTDNGANTEFHIKLYERHLKVWNNLTEKKPRKIGLDEYMNSFRQISNDVKNNRFDFNKSPVVITKDKDIYNGGHRMASGIFYNVPVKYRIGSPGEGELMSCDKYMKTTGFVPEGLGEDWADAMTMEYLRLKKGNTFIATLFPSAIGKDNEVQDILNKYGCRIIRKKHIEMYDNMPYNYMRQTYYGETWAGNKNNNYSGFREKTKLCFGKGGDTRVFAFETKYPETLPTCKQEIRDLYGLQKHSIHINDTFEETIRIAGIFFNRNSLNFIKTANLRALDKFDGLFSQYVKWIYSCQDEEKFCVDASAVLSAYGLRDCRDLDFLKFGVPCIDPSSQITRHNKEAKYYDRHIDDIIWNPNNHFYYCGVKFATPDIIIAMKNKRNEPKDVKDVELLEGIK